MNSIILSNGVVQLCLGWTDTTASLAQALMKFLQPWFRPATTKRKADLTVHLRSPSAFVASWRARCVEPFVLRRSSAPLFNLVVKRGLSEEGMQLAWDEQRNVGYVIDSVASGVTLYGELSTAFIHLIELVRYYGLLIEQAQGTVILHSAAVRQRDSDNVIAIIGAKGAGKTTTMLSLLANKNYVYFSGDKLLLSYSEGELKVRGWPDYPHVGIGTLHSHAGLAQRLEIRLDREDGTPLPSQHKVLIEPSQYLAAIGEPSQACGHLSNIVLPRIHEGGQARYIVMAENEKEAVSPGDLFEWPHRFITATWHGLPWSARTYSEKVPSDLMCALRKLPWNYRFGMSNPPIQTARGAL